MIIPIIMGKPLHLWLGVLLFVLIVFQIAVARRILPIPFRWHRIMGYVILLLAVIHGSIAITATGGSAAKNEQPSAPTPDKNTVLIQNYQFRPAEITIEKGETITWINQDSAGHTATGESFDSGLLSKGQSFQHAFHETGEIEYICTPHPYMKEKIIIQ